jgi:hypothetical protein
LSPLKRRASGKVAGQRCRERLGAVKGSADRREKVLREIKRPVFSLLDHGPLYEKCTFLSYDAVRSISREKHLSIMLLS